MNLFNLLGTGQDLNTGSFVTLNGKAWRESIADFRKAFTEANNMGVTKKGKLLSWLAGNLTVIKIWKRTYTRILCLYKNSWKYTKKEMTR